MSVNTYLSRLAQMDTLIHLKASGSPSDFASKLEISLSSLHQYLDVMRGMGAEIGYCRRRRTYYYTNGKRLILGYYPTRGGGMSDFFQKISPMLYFWTEAPHL